jgi:alkyl hydroperoxide reductase subunit F
MEFKLNTGSFSDEKKFLAMDEGALYDVLILGGGPAGLTAAVYCMRKGVKAGLIVRDAGGQVAETYGIENYMGYRFVSGFDLVVKFKEQVLQFGIGYLENAVVKAIEPGKIHRAVLEDGRVFSARAVIISTGKSPKKLGVPGEAEFSGRGVAYCSTCDAPLFGGRSVVVAGGGNSGVEAAIDLARVASRVVLVQFLDKLTADDVLVKRLESFGNVSFRLFSDVVEIKGRDAVESVIIRDRKTSVTEQIAADGIFIEIGLVPNSGAVKDIVKLNRYGEIEIDSRCLTSEPGIFAAGDVTDVPYKQIIIAGGEGAKAALSACEYILSSNA